MRIFITGITGTLGRAFVEHLHYDHVLSGVDHNEGRVADLRRTHPHVNVKLGDFGEVDFTTDTPDVVIHMAAFKHVDLCEVNPSACIFNNVIKTFDLFQECHRNGVPVLFMSTDKAVEPCSVYGYSKALMEAMVLELGGAFARSGNILQSNGSVLTIWEDAIRRGEPLRVTHRDMRRYFISPENLAERVWKHYLDGERVIIPQMDLDITLMELADQTLRRFGESIDTYPIVFTGLRPGEKLKEKLHHGDTGA